MPSYLAAGRCKPVLLVYQNRSGFENQRAESERWFLLNLTFGGRIKGPWKPRILGGGMEQLRLTASVTVVSFVCDVVSVWKEASGFSTGQSLFRKQGRYCSAFPLQGKPPNWGDGLLHFLSRVILPLPPHVFEQGDHRVHLDHAPSIDGQ